MDEVGKFRVIGAIIWLLLLVVIVPIWYNNPVNFQPDAMNPVNRDEDSTVVYQAFTLPVPDPMPEETTEVGSESGVVAGKPTSSERVEPVVSQAEVKPVLPPKSQSPESQELKSVKPVVKSEPKAVSTPPKETRPVVKAPPEDVREVKPGQWILKIYASTEIKEANRVLGLLDAKYDVWIKEYEKSGAFSVRTGPYNSKEQALKDKNKIDRAIHTQSELVQVK